MRIGRFNTFHVNWSNKFGQGSHARKRFNHLHLSFTGVNTQTGAPPPPSGSPKFPPGLAGLTGGMPNPYGLLPPAALAAMAATKTMYGQQQSLPVSTPTSSLPSSRMPNMTTSTSGRGNSRGSPTKIPRVGQGQVTCNCGTVFPNLEMLELHAKAVHPENTNLVRLIFVIFINLPKKERMRAQFIWRTKF